MNFNKLILLLLLSLNLSATTNKTFFLPNTKGQELIINQSQTFFIRRYKLQNLKDDFFINNSWFYEESCSAGGLAKYFMPNGKTELLVQGQAVATPGVTDIYAEWLGIPSSGYMDDEANCTFSSRFSISPELKRWGTKFSIYKKVHKNIWFSILVPFENVSTNANLNEYQITGARPESLEPDNNILFYEEPLNVTQALSHPLMKYGRIDNIKHQKAGIADINLKLGITKKYKNKYLYDFYFQGVVPTADKPTAEYLFEPIAGNAHHFGVGCGIKFNTNFKDLTILSTFDYLYLFSGTEKRSFDLYNGPWSRYMAATSALPRTRPERLINYLTQDLKVSPGSHFNALFALNWKKNKFNFEFGTNIECKSNEKVSLKNGWSENVAIASYDHAQIDNLIPDIYKLSRSNGKINSPMIINATFFDANFTPIKLDDLNIDSARNLNYLSINPYCSLALDGSFINNPFNISLGVFYKANSNNKSLGSFGSWINFNLVI